MHEDPDGDPVSLSAPAALDAALSPSSSDARLWEESVWHAVARLMPVLDEARVRSSWSGFYDYCTWDQNALMGPHPQGARNVYYATGFSGHGIQQARFISIQLKSE